ncbi:hypothetical protein D3C79_1062050 [compost metagenome]
MAMLHRVEVDVIEVPLVVEVVTDQVLPIATLPDTPLTTFLLGIAARFRVRQSFGKGELDRLPAIRIRPVAWR